MFRFL